MSRRFGVSICFAWEICLLFFFEGGGGGSCAWEMGISRWVKEREGGLSSSSCIREKMRERERERGCFEVNLLRTRVLESGIFFRIWGMGDGGCFRLRFEM